MDSGMSYELLARFTSFQEDEEALVFSLADDELAATKYVTLQRSSHPQKQDVEQQLDGLYIERDDQQYGCYLGVQEIRRDGNRIEIHLTDHGKRMLDLAGIVIIALPSQPVVDQALVRLAELSGGEYVVTLA